MEPAKRCVGFWAVIVTLLASFVLASGASAGDKKPNILILWGDDIGYWNISAYNQGPVPNATAKKLLDEVLAIEEAEVALKRSTAAKLAPVLPATKVARYIQIENKIRALVRFELADKIPLVK